MKEKFLEKLNYLGKIIKKNRVLLAFVFFLISITIFSDYGIIVLIKKYKTLNELKQQELYLKNKLEIDSTRYMELKKDNISLEKFAREQYYFHKSNEDVFIIEKTN